ncbi:hypothetical protein [Prosthecomicrobium sp. N25]|uniref:hypothetical protein n=1 Tax=Prosthecomicrobium sp. N25 TaxID=3129254 RepID=UPI0030784F9A
MQPENREQLFAFLLFAHKEIGKYAFASNKGKIDTLNVSSTIQALEATQLSIIEKYNTLLVDNINTLEQERRRLSTEFEAERASLLARHEEQNIRLEAQRSELEAIRRQVDDRTNTHARREIRKDIKSALEAQVSKFALSKDTVGLRTPITITCFIFICISACAMIFSFWDVHEYLSQERDRDLVMIGWLMLRSLLAFAVLVSLLGFYLRWQNEWFKRNSEAEFVVRQTQIDIDRASWAIESALEWQMARQSDIPEALLTGITHDLFRRTPQSSEAVQLNAADHLASAILGSASKLRLDSTGAALELDRKGLSRLEK